MKQYSFCHVFALVLLVCQFSLSQETVPRLSIPNEAAQTEASALVQEVFGSEIENSKTSEQREEIIAKLLQEAAKPNDPAGRYALLQAALNVAPDAIAAMPIIDEMSKYFQMDAFRKKASTVWRMSRKARGSVHHQAVANAAISLMDLAIERDAYDLALKLGEIALSAARIAKDAALSRTVRTKVFEVGKQKNEFEKVKDSLAALENDPRNAKANNVVGRYKCFVKGDWEAGVPMLALSDDEVLKELAVRDLTRPTTSNEQVAIADSWYQLGEKASGQTKIQMQKRAGFWYQVALRSEPALSGWSRQR